MKVHIFNLQKDIPLKKRSIQRVIRSLLSFLKIECDEIAIYFVTAKKICQLHDEFFNDPSITDCISFPLDKSYLGEIFVCPKQALLYSEKRRIDPKEEVILYLIHGLLHLIGYDDLDPKSKKIMRRKEKSCMRHLKKVREC